MSKQTIESLAGKYLGRSISSSDHYDPSLLNPIPREENRTKYNIDSEDLPFQGMDIWHCYELSFLNKNGFPINVVAKIAYSCESEFIIESKSLKLYLNSFNMQKVDTENIEEAKEIVRDTIITDLGEALHTRIYIQLHNNFGKGTIYNDFADLDSQYSYIDLSTIVCDNYNEAPEVLLEQDGDTFTEYKFTWSGLRSNCRVTHQPDFGNVYIHFKGAKNATSIESIIKYLVSFRNENHFHEEVVEMIYKRLLDYLKPEELMVGALYTRRGGIDICPLRVSNPELIDENWIDVSKFVKVNGRQ